MVYVTYPCAQRLLLSASLCLFVYLTACRRNWRTLSTGSDIPSLQGWRPSNKLGDRALLLLYSSPILTHPGPGVPVRYSAGRGRSSRHCHGTDRSWLSKCALHSIDTKRLYAIAAVRCQVYAIAKVIERSLFLDLPVKSSRHE